MSRVKRLLRDALRGPSAAAVVAEEMREPKRESAAAVVYCADCGSRNVLARTPDGALLTFGDRTPGGAS